MLSGISLLLACGLTLNNAVSMPETATVSETQSVYSENIYTPPAIHFVSDGRDIYESNDGFNVATPLSPENAHQLSSYHTQLTATIDTLYEFVDVDYYVLTLYVDSYVRLSVETDHSDYSFDLLLMKRVSIIDEGQIVKNNPNVYENDTSDKIKNYEGLLSAGNYFVYIRGQQPATSTITLEYTLNVVVNRTNTYASVSIGDLRFNKQLSGAVWLSEYVPFNTVSIAETHNEYDYYLDMGNGTDQRDYLLENLTRLSEGNPIHFATIYIWDRVLAYVLYKVIDTLYTYFAETIKEIELQNLHLEVTSDSLNNASIVITQLNKVIASLSVSISKIVKAVGFVIKFANFIVKSFIQEINVSNSILYTRYLGFLQGLFYEEFQAVEDNPDPEDLDNQRLQKVFQIPLYYSLRTEIFNFGANSRSVLSYRATLEKFNQGDQFLCTSSSIPTNPTDCYNCYGKVYGIDRTSEIDTLTSLPEYSSIPDAEPEIREISISQNSESRKIQLLEGEYVWYQFEAPETKDYYFLCSAGKDIVIDLFSQPVKGHSTEGLIRSYEGGYYLLSQSHEAGCYFSRLLNDCQTIYLRIRNGYYHSSDPGLLYVDDAPFAFAEPLQHEHHYDNRYVWKNRTQHTAYCECGAGTVQGHAVSSGSSRCLLCGGLADTGFIGPLSVTYRTENGSYILPNGVIVLDDRDIDAYLTGNLVFADHTQSMA